MPSSIRWKHIVLRFGKALTQQPCLLDNPDDFGPLYIPLGYFDTLQLYSLSDDNDSSWLSQLHIHDVNLSNKLSDQFFFHSIHCRAFSDNPKEFMEMEAPYLFVTFLQGKCLDGRPVTNTFGESIRKYLEENVGEPFSTKEDAVYWTIYRSIALSDLIIMWKSASILAILRAIQKVYYFSMTGDLHSIPAILKNSILGEGTAPSIQREELPQVTIRYLVKNAHAAFEFFKSAGLYEDLPKFTVGIEDLTYVNSNWTTLDLRKVLAKRLTDDEYIKKFREAFAECGTHLGDELTPGENNPFKLSSLYEQCNTLQMAFQETRKRLNDSHLTDDLDDPWLKASSELYNAQANLCRNKLADGFCFLTYGASSMFQKKVSNTKARFTSDQLHQIQRFVRGWDDLMEQVLRTDGKFSQQPYFTPPPLCEVPSNLLEFYLAFTIQACTIMRSISGEREKFALLLVPQLCRRIKVESIFLDDPPCDRLLLVGIPISVLYDPFMVLSHLCHEIGHFAGDGWRQRNARADAYFSICAQELAGVFMFSKSETVTSIRQHLPQSPFDFPVYLNMLKSRLYEQLEIILNDQEIVLKWFNIEYSSNDLNRRVCQLQSNRKIQDLASELTFHRNDPSGDFFNIMDEFEYLFRECYADIVAIYTLRLTPCDYIHLADQELKLYRRTYKEEGPGYYLAVERWAIVLNVSFSHDELLKIEKSPFTEDINECINFLFRGQQLDSSKVDKCQNSYHKPESVGILREYLCRCLRLMEETDKDKTGRGNNLELDEIRIAFRNVVQTNDIFSECCQSIVSKYRLNILMLD